MQARIRVAALALQDPQVACFRSRPARLGWGLAARLKPWALRWQALASTHPSKPPVCTPPTHATPHDTRDAGWWRVLHSPPPTPSLPGPRAIGCLASQVQLLDGGLATCLAPVVSLANHAPTPHIVHFSRVDAASRCLRLRCFRPAPPGAQLFLSYGPYDNAHLLLFYGFALPNNPFDEAPLSLPAPAAVSAATPLATATEGPLHSNLHAGSCMRAWAPACL